MATKRSKTKTATLIQLMSKEGGATAAKLLKVTGWQPHSLRGFVAGTCKKRGLSVISSKINGSRVYQIVARKTRKASAQ